MMKLTITQYAQTMRTLGKFTLAIAMLTSALHIAGMENNNIMENIARQALYVGQTYTEIPQETWNPLDVHVKNLITFSAIKFNNVQLLMHCVEEQGFIPDMSRAISEARNAGAQNTHTYLLDLYSTYAPSV